MRNFPVSSDQAGAAASVWKDRAVRSTRRGEFWVPSEPFQLEGKTYQQGPLYGSWEAPETVSKRFPIVLIHGGAMQATEWLDTPDGRPGWAQRLVEAGYAVFVVDRPTQGRSPFSTEVIGEMGPAFAYEEGEEVFFPAKAAKKHTQFPIDTKNNEALGAFIAAFGPLPVGIELWQTMDADRIAKLLDRIGPAILFTHSASGSDGWLVADRRPELVAGIVSVEPMGPPFCHTPNIGTLAWGLTGARMNYEPPHDSPESAKGAEPESLRIPALQGVPVAIVSGETSAQSAYAPDMVTFLQHSGAAVNLLHLPDFGIMGNGHGLIYEMNSDEALQPVLQWLEVHVSA